MLFMDAAVPRPLIRSHGLRAVLAAALGATALLAVPVAWFMAIFDPPAWLLPATVAALLASPFAGSAIVTGRWSRTRELRWLQVGAVTALLGVGALIAAAGASRVLGELGETAWGGSLLFASDTLPNGLVYIAAALIAIALLLAALPLPVSDVAARTLVVTCVGPAVFLVGGAVAVQESTASCGSYELDRARWQADIPQGGTDATLAMAKALARCDTLDGATRAEVRELLGRPHIPSARREWTWQVGWVNSDYGLGDGETMTVVFDRRGHVRDTRLAYGD